MQLIQALGLTQDGRGLFPDEMIKIFNWHKLLSRGMILSQLSL
jgi:hypothetical protein